MTRSMSSVARNVSISFALVLAGQPGFAGLAPAVVFGPGTLLIPMDLGNPGFDDGQDDEMLRAYGLAYALLRDGVPVHWSIHPAKAANGSDFTIAAGDVRSVRNNGVVSLPRPYRGGPFLIAAANRAAALPIIAAWQAVPGDETEVHDIVAGSVDAPVARILVAAPRIGLVLDGNETIAFNDLNAAGILDSTGGSWGYSSLDLLTEAQLVGPSQTDPDDGVLFHQPSGLTRNCFLASMHYNSTSLTAHVVREVRAWLAAGPSTQLYGQCQSTEVFENDATQGHLLTTLGIEDDGGAAAAPQNRNPSHPIAQIDGAYSVDSGSVDSMGLNAGSTFRTGTQTLFNENAVPVTTRITLLTGRMDGTVPPTRGQVTYLGGHDYSLSLPVSNNPQTNGVRIFLNALFASDCAQETPQVPTLTKSGPGSTAGSTIPYTLEISNPGPRPLENLRLRDVLPAGSTYVGGSAVPPPSSTAGGVLTWLLPPIASGGVTNVSFSVSVTADDVYLNRATLDYALLTVHQMASNTVSTTRDTVPPDIAIPGAPDNPVYTDDTTPTFEFEVTGGATVVECQVDAGGYVGCTSPFTAAIPLTEGEHTFYVRAFDAADNSSTESLDFTVDLSAPTITGVASVAAAAWTPPQAAASIRSAITRILVSFDDPMAESGTGSVTSADNWRVYGAGPNGILESIFCGSTIGDDTIVPIVSHVYDAPTQTLALTEASGFGLRAGNYRLFACPTLENLAGLHPAPDDRDFSIVAEPEVENPNFDDAISTWSALGPIPSDWGWLEEDAEGVSLHSGAAQLDTVGGAGATWYLEQCFDTVATGLSRMTSLVEIASGVAGAPTLRGTLTWYDAPNCAGNLLDTEATPIRAGSTGGSWETLATASILPPPDAESALLSFRVQGGAASTYAVRVDRVLWPEPLALFADGFESGDTCEWNARLGAPPC